MDIRGFHDGIEKMDVSVAVDARIKTKIAHSNLIELFKCTAASISPRLRAGTNRNLFAAEIVSNPATRIILISNVLPYAEPNKEANDPSNIYDMKTPMRIMVGTVITAITPKLCPKSAAC